MHTKMPNKHKCNYKMLTKKKPTPPLTTYIASKKHVQAASGGVDGQLCSARAESIARWMKT